MVNTWRDEKISTDTINNFMKYLKTEFPNVLDNHFTYELIENMLRFAYNNYGHSKDMAKTIIYDIIPEITWEELDKYLPEFSEDKE